MSDEPKPVNYNEKRGTRPRSFICPDDLWFAAQVKAASNDETVARVLRRALRDYIDAEGKQ